MALSFGIGVFLVLVCFVFQYLMLRQVASKFIPIAGDHSGWIAVGGLILIAVSWVEIVFFALGLLVADRLLGLGTLAGEFGGNTIDYFYFSAITFTTVGYGDIFPTGGLKIIAAIESHVGLMMIAWSGTFAFFFLKSNWATDAQGGDVQRSGDGDA